MNTLDKILAVKRDEVAARKTTTPLSTLHDRALAQTPPRGFRAALDAKAVTGYGLIAEIKKASP
ncbi:indole-3-glycerol-phosphate synthase TrpC, partial [Staphylococcus aureus]|nr:indole-3-glycerol-phosphate synthase TrpC [Staphylococcus aureus]